MIFLSLEKYLTFKKSFFFFFESQKSRTKRYGIACIAYKASQIWQTVLMEIRDSISQKISIIKEKHGIAMRFHATAPSPVFTT